MNFLPGFLGCAIIIKEHEQEGGLRKKYVYLAVVSALFFVNSGHAMTIYAKMLTGQTVTPQAMPSDTVLSLKQQIEYHIGDPPTQQRLVYSRLAPR